MGYYSILDAQFECEKAIDAKGLKQELEDLDKKELMNPFTGNIEITSNETVKNHFVMVIENYVKMGDYHDYIPLIAELCKKYECDGLIDVQGDEPMDLWRVEFLKNGKFYPEIGEVQYKEVNLGDL